MAERTREHQWSTTPVGCFNAWPEPLLCAVNLALSSKFPTHVCWGPELTLFYNDAFAPFLGEKHPSALGGSARNVWSEAWHIIAPQFAAVLAGESIFRENVLVPVNRNGQLQDLYWTYSYSPIFLQTGAVAGILTVCQETTAELLAKQALRESEAQASRILQSIGDAVIVTGADTCVTRMNPVAETLTGWNAEEALGHPLAEVFNIVSETTGQRIESPADKVKRLGTVVGLANHTILIAKDGTETHIDDSGAPIRNDEGELTGIVLVFRNINERRAAERQRDELVEKLNQAFAATTDTVVSVDRDWIISFMNPAAQRMLGPSGEILGKPLWEMFPDAFYEGSPFVEHYYRAMDDGVSGSFEAYYPAPLNMWIQIEAYPAKDGIIVFSRDITLRKLAEDTLRNSQENALRSEAELKLITDALPAFVSYLDRDLRYRRVNRRYEEWFGQPAAKMLGRSVGEVLGDAAASHLRPYLQAAFDGTPQHFEYRITIGDQERVLAVSHIPEFGEDGTVRGVVVQGHDITDQKRTEQALIQNEKLAAVGRLAASIAHEINNPLESVTNLLYLARSAESESELQEYLETAERELRRVAVISNQTLRFYKQPTGASGVSVEDLLESVLSIYRGRIVNSHISVEKKLRAKRSVVCFEGEIRQVLSNLISNAIDAMHPNGGRLLIRSREVLRADVGTTGVVITVADTGSGMPAEVLRKVFEAFFTTKGIAGNGLGLWISKEIVERHRGNLRVRSSRKEGSSGTVFLLYLPIEAADSTVRP